MMYAEVKKLSGRVINRKVMICLQKREDRDTLYKFLSPVLEEAKKDKHYGVLIDHWMTEDSRKKIRRYILSKDFFDAMLKKMEKANIDKPKKMSGIADMNAKCFHPNQETSPNVRDLEDIRDALYRIEDFTD